MLHAAPEPNEKTPMREPTAGDACSSSDVRLTYADAVCIGIKCGVPREGPEGEEVYIILNPLGLDVLDTTPEEHFDGLVNLGKCASSSSPNSN